MFAVGGLGGFFGASLVGSLREFTDSFLPGLALLLVGVVVLAAAGLRLPAS